MSSLHLSAVFRAQVPDVHLGPTTACYAHAAKAYPSGVLPPGEESMRLRLGWLCSGVVQVAVPCLTGSSTDEEPAGNISTNTLRSLFPQFHYQWRDKISFHLIPLSGLFVAKFIVHFWPSAFRDGAKWIYTEPKSLLPSTHGCLPAF